MVESGWWQGQILLILIVIVILFLWGKRRMMRRRRRTMRMRMTMRMSRRMIARDQPVFNCLAPALKIRVQLWPKFRACVLSVPC
jgi:hypothetical protein